MTCPKCNPTMRRHCPTGKELVAAVRDAFSAKTEFVAKHGIISPSLQEAYTAVKRQYMEHVYGGIRR